jgi:hypothetical protein
MPPAVVKLDVPAASSSSHHTLHYHGAQGKRREDARGRGQRLQSPACRQADGQDQMATAGRAGTADMALPAHGSGGEAVAAEYRGQVVFGPPDCTISLYDQLKS